MKVISRDMDNHRIQFSDKEIESLLNFFDGCIDGYEDAKPLMPFHNYLQDTHSTLVAMEDDDE